MVCLRDDSRSSADTKHIVSAMFQWYQCGKDLCKLCLRFPSSMFTYKSGPGESEDKQLPSH
jgi:hypothetical protein